MKIDDLQNLSAHQGDNGAVHASLLPPDTQLRSKPLKTEGEKRFDFLTYFGVNYGVNMLISIAALCWAERTGGGRKFMENFGKFASKYTGTGPETGRTIASKTFFLSGGFAVLAPVKWLEDAKLGLVKKWNREIYGNHMDTDPALIAADKKLETDNKQTWGTVISSRVLSLIPFYITVGLLWDRTSMLSRLTNPQLGKMSKEAAKHMADTDPIAFSAVASKGFYLDKPVTAAARWIGNLLTKLTGNKKATEQIAKMRQNYAGMMKEGAEFASRDPLHSALPYYVSTEATLSGMVAAATYGFTKALGPIIGQESNTPNKTTPQTTVALTDIQHIPPKPLEAKQAK